MERNEAYESFSAAC
jgi:hypothetical protein